jgi:hypothetical protein
MAKPRLIHNLDKTRWVNLTRIKEFTITKDNRDGVKFPWKVIAWLDDTHCFTCHEEIFQKDAEAWMEELIK